MEKDNLENKLAPWIKADGAGRLYTDFSNPQHKALWLAQLDFLTQYSIVNGSLQRTNDKGLNWPDWKKYAFPDHPQEPEQ